MSTIKHSNDRILPVQKSLSNNYKHNSSEYFERLHNLMMQFNKNTDIQKFDLLFPKKFTYFQMGSDIPSLHFLQFIIGLSKYKKILEIGSFMGVSAMYLADATNNGHVTTIEVGEEFYNIALRNIQNNGYSEKVTVIHANANHLLENIRHNKYDFIYLDGDKENYNNLFKILMPLLDDDGLFVIDDVLLNGEVLNDDIKTKKGIGVDLVLKEVACRNDVESFLLPLSNGKLLVRKK